MDIQMTQDARGIRISYADGPIQLQGTGLTKEQAQALAARLLQGLLTMSGDAAPPSPRVKVLAAAPVQRGKEFTAIYHVGKADHRTVTIQAPNKEQALKKAEAQLATVEGATGVRVYDDPKTAEAAEKKRVWWVLNPKKGKTAAK